MSVNKRHRFDSQIQGIVSSALFGAICCIATLIIQIPVSVTGGYINLGDSVVLISAWILGPVYGTLAAAIGSAMADLLTGYALYAPATFVIKGLMALCAYGVFRMTKSKHKSKPPIWCTVISALSGELVMVGGYFIFSAFILRMGLAALPNVYGDSVQALGGLIGSNLLFLLVRESPLFKRLNAKK